MNAVKNKSGRAQTFNVFKAQFTSIQQARGPSLFRNDWILFTL